MTQLLSRSGTALLAATLATLAACGDPDTADPVVNTVAIFDPAGDLGLPQPVPVPNDLLISGSLDGTLNLPEDGTDPVTSLNSLEGWSTVAPVTIPFSGPIDAATVTGNPPLPGQGSEANVRVFEVTTSGIGGIVTGVTGELVQGVDYLAALSPDTTTVVVLPLVPFAASTDYMVTVSNGIRDVDGLPVQPALIYDLAASDFDIDDPTLESLRTLIQAQQAEAETQGVVPSSLVMSFSFRTQVVGGPVGFVANFAAGGGSSDAAEEAALAGLLAANPALVFAPDDATGSGGLLADPDNTATMGSFAQVAGLVDSDGLIDVYQGSLTIPSYLEPGDSVSGAVLSQDTDPLTTRWESRFAFGDPAETERHVNANNPAPRTRGTVTIPVLVTVPSGAGAGADLPVVIFQHGVTGARSNLLGVQLAAGTVNSANSIAGEFAGVGVACVAIDLPLHGLAEDADPGDGLFVFEELFVGYDTADGTNSALRERTYGLDLINNALGVGPPTAPVDGIADPSGFHVLGNLSNLRTLRDDLRQGVADLLWLRSAIGDVDLGAGAPNLDATDVSFVGHSLGAMVGVPYLVGAQAAAAVSALDFSHATSVLAVPGGGIAELLLNSETFGDTIATGIAAGAGFDVLDPGFDINDPAVQATIAAFAVAAQSVLDDIDPINFGAAYTAGAVPTLLTEVVGNFDAGGAPLAPANDPDQVIPNNVPITGTPFVQLAGTDPLITALGLDVITTNVSNSSGAVRFSFGAHSSLITPFVPVSGFDAANLALAFDDQNDIATEFVDTAGTAITVSDNTTVDTDG
ncbi:MAG: hypothetical protein AAFZ65_00425 [Planctomycetota bacterium]